MNSKTIRKKAAHLFAWLGLNVCSLIIKAIPVWWVYNFAETIAHLGYAFAGKHRKVAIESLTIAFGKEKTKQEIKQITKSCFESMAKSAVELMYLLDKPDLLDRRVEIAGRDNLKAALSKGKGVILVSAHFGNFPLLLAKLSLGGFKVNGIMRPMRDSRVERIFSQKRERFKVNTIYSQPRNTCVETTIKKLRNNELVFIPIDQNFGTGGIFVDFFGKKAATATGPVVLAQRTKAGILPCFIVRQKGDTHKIIFEPALELEEGKDRQETLITNIQKLTDIIEEYIRKYPPEWGWIHRRWKSRPAIKKEE